MSVVRSARLGPLLLLVLVLVVGVEAHISSRLSVVLVQGATLWLEVTLKGYAHNLLNIHMKCLVWTLLSRVHSVG